MRLASETISCPTEGEEMTGQDPKKNDLDTRAFRDDAGGAVGQAFRLSEAHRFHSRGRLCYIPVTRDRQWVLTQWSAPTGQSRCPPL